MPRFVSGKRFFKFSRTVLLRNIGNVFTVFALMLFVSGVAALAWLFFMYEAPAPTFTPEGEVTLDQKKLDTIISTFDERKKIFEDPIVSELNDPFH